MIPSIHRASASTSRRRRRRRAGGASRAPRGRTAREIAATLGVSLPFDHREEIRRRRGADDGAGAAAPRPRRARMRRRGVERRGGWKTTGLRRVRSGR